MNIIEIWMDGHSKSRAMMNFPICQSFSFFLLLEVSSFNGSAKIERKICTKE